MNILVTGGCGLAGSFAVRHAVEQGHRVVAFDIALKTDLLTDVLDRVDLVRGDLTSAPDIMRAVEEHSVERILHTASFLTGAAFERPYAAAQLMVMGTLNVLEAARTLGVKRVVHVSTGKTMATGAQYAKSAGTGGIGISPDPYTSCKVAAELLCNDYAKLYDMSVVIIRYAQLFGPGYDFAGGSGKAIKPVVEACLRGETVTMSAEEASLFSTPPGQRPNRSLSPSGLLYAKDAGRAGVLAATSERLTDNVFRIQPMEALTMHGIAERLMRIIPGGQIEVPDGPDPGGPVEPDARAKEQFDYVPEYDVERGLREYVGFLKTGRYETIA